MNEQRVEKSCWGVTVKAVLGFAGVLLLTWLIGGSESVSTLASAG